MRLTLPRLEATDPATCWPRCAAPSRCPPTDDPDAGRATSLPASITYSYAHLAERTRRLLPAVSLFHGVADENLLMAFSAVRGGAGPVRRGQPGGVDGGAGGRGPGRAADRRWAAACTGSTRPCPATSPPDGTPRTPAATTRSGQACEQALCTASAAFSQWLTGQIESGNAALAYAVIGLQRRTLGAMLGHALDRQAWDDADGIVRALDEYWDTRGLGGEADAWADRILEATAGHWPGPA